MAQNCANVVSKGIAKKARLGGDGTLDGHHLFPQKFAKEFQAAGVDVDQWVKNIERTAHRELHSGKGFGKGGKGGVWNGIWRGVLDQTANMSRDERLQKLFGVATQMIERL